jgi:hypothetical protein
MPGPLVPLSKTAAEWSLSISELSLVVFAAVVVIGLVGEHKAKPRADPWRPATIKPAGWKPPGWNWPKAWEWVVIAGIIGELIGDGGVWVSSDALQAISDRETAVLADSTEHLRAANLALLQRFAPRSPLSAGQIAVIKATIVPGVRFIIRASEGKEPVDLEKELRSILLDAGAVEPPQERILPRPSQPEGLTVVYARDDPTAASIFRALDRAGLHPVDAGNSSQESVVYIAIGTPMIFIQPDQP